MKMVTKIIYFFIGTTAELIKLFPVIRELEQRKVEFKIITSGQTGVNFNEVSNWIKKTKPDIAFPQKVNQSSMPLFLIWIIKTSLKAPFLLSKEFRNVDKSNSLFIVHGDTVSSLIGALVARLFRLKVVHIESGLRSFNFSEPFPEEITRFIISKFADVHFCPNKWSLNNLRLVTGQKINTFQNTFIESYTMASTKSSNFQKKGIGKGKYFVFVLHRQEHVVFKKKESRRLVEFIVDNTPPDLSCVFIKHATNSKLLGSLNKKKTIFQSRLAYTDFVHLLEGAEFLVTDGGGNQEEAYYMGLPCLLLRNCTERTEGLEENVVLSRNNKKTIESFLKDYRNFRRKGVRMVVGPSKIIIDYLLCN